MNKKSFICLVTMCVSVFLFAQGVVAQSAVNVRNNTDIQTENDITFRGWRQADTEHFRFVFEEASRQATEVYAQYADEAWNKIAKIYALPQDKTNIYVTARTNTVNAYTFFAPPEIMMFTTFCSMDDFGFRDSWQKLFFTHELVHIANIQFEDKSNIASKLIGPFANVIGMSDVPGWALEGLTTVLETELTDGGRGRSPYFELMYKAPTLDNAFISYAAIGQQAEPPQGQSYVMGYLIMRSIADRWGMQALADIERNRSLSVSWEDSVKLVTGESAEDIYKDVRIALAKKYASERSIPEGVTISPRTTNTYYYKPAIVNDDGTLITLRSAKNVENAVVRLDPSAKEGSDYIENAHPEKDLNTVVSETVLFTADFSNKNAITADASGTVYASIAKQRADRMPGSEVEYALYKWTKDSGLKQLTKSGTYFEPSVSRDGNVLVAVQQRGLQVMLVRVDTESGEVTPLLQKENISFAHPAVNDDGSKVAFLVLDGHRAAVAFAPIGHMSSYTIVANGEGDIVDPTNPSWNSDGSLTYACNTRGRLEVFEVNDELESTPVVSDPIGALWAYKTERGVYYESYASTGYVIKMKPAEEWGAVPEDEGPSAAGEKICFGALESDYPLFVPYEKPSEKEVPAEKKDSSPKDKTKKVPVAIRGKTVAHRSDENKKRAEESTTVQTTLQNERLYVPLPQPVFYIPIVNEIDSGKDNSESNWGVGYGIFCMTPKLQMQTGVIEAAATYFPDINNIEGEFVASIPIGPMTLDFIAARLLENIQKTDGSYRFVEINDVLVGYTYPLIHRKQHHNEIDLSMLLYGEFETGRTNDETYLSFDSDAPYLFTIDYFAGFDFLYTKQCKRSDVFELMTTTLAMGTIDPVTGKSYVGFEGEVGLQYGSNLLKYETSVRGRYTDFPSESIPSQSRAHLSDARTDCSYPGRVVPRIGMVVPNFLNLGMNMELYAEKLFSFGKNSVDFTTPDSGRPGNITFDNIIVTGTELSMTMGRNKLAAGYTFKINTDDADIDYGDFYLSVKYNWLRK